MYQANDILVHTGIESLLSELWGQRYFMASDLVNGQAEVLAEWYEGRLLHRSRDFTSRSGNLSKWADLLPGWGAPEIAHEADGLAARYTDAAAKAKTTAGGMSLIARVSRFGVSPGITVFGIMFDMKTGTPPEKAIIKGIAGFAASAAFLAIFSGPPGWLVGFSIVVGMAASAVSGPAYDYLVPDRYKARIDPLRRARFRRRNDRIPCHRWS